MTPSRETKESTITFLMTKFLRYLVTLKDSFAHVGDETNASRAEKARRKGNANRHDPVT
jgi:hypothetical protein